MNKIAIIPARGGSKRISHKNIKNFLGKPIIAYSIEMAKSSGLFDEIMVSTDSKEIAEVALSFGASVPFVRSPENSNDFAILADVMQEVLDEYKKNNQFFHLGCCLLPTAPLISKSNLFKGLNILIKGNFDSVRPIVKFSYPIQRAFKFDIKTSQVEMFYPQYFKTRSQDLEPAYHDAGQLYWFVAEKGLRGENKGAFEISEIEAQDIDNETDWLIAELKHEALKKIHQSVF